MFWHLLGRNIKLSVPRTKWATRRLNYSKNLNSSFYSWNFDLSYLWWFAPGSQVSVLYRNNAANFERIIKILTKRDQFTK
jgi:hypothetical protein